MLLKLRIYVVTRVLTFGLLLALFHVVLVALAFITQDNH